MPRSVKEVVKDFEMLSSSPKAGRTATTPPRPKSTPQTGSSIVHPLLRVSPALPITPHVHELPSKKPISVTTIEPYPVSSAYPVTKRITTPPRYDAPVSLSRSPYDPAITLSSSKESYTIKLGRSIDLTIPRSARPPIAPSSSSDHHTIHIPNTPYPLPSMSTLEAVQPVEGEQLFSRDAPILSLPALDNYLAAIPAPHFSPISKPIEPVGLSVKSTSSQTVPPMFPPLAELSKGQSLVDLLHNKSITPNWRNRNSIFGFVSAVCWGLSLICLIDKYICS